MKIIAIILVIALAIFLDVVLDVLTFIGIPFFIANLIPVFVIGWVLEQFSAGFGHRSAIGKFLRIFIFGAILSFVILTAMAWILKLVLILVVLGIAIAT